MTQSFSKDSASPTWVGNTAIYLNKSKNPKLPRLPMWFIFRTQAFQ